MILLNLLAALLATIMIEALVAVLLGYRGRRFFIVLILVNFATNPLLNLLVIGNELFQAVPKVPLLICLELLAVAIEGLLFSFALRRRWPQMLKLSLILNLSSFLSGYLIFNY